MFDYLFTNLPTISIPDIILNVFLAFIIGFFISIIYRRTYKGFSYSMSFVNTLVIIAMVTSIVIMVIGNNLARAFGLVGAMSIIRFRTVVKDTRDIAFVFFSLAGGMAAGAGNHSVGIVGAFMIGLVIIFFYLFDYGAIKTKELLLKFFLLPQPDDESIYLPVFNKYLSSHTLLNVKSARMGQFLELSFHIRLKDLKNHQKFIYELGNLEGIERISLIFGEDNEGN